ncbi:hypothetical protein [Vibrio phage S4-7]|nr:hypothetical protein [Vibrio phage S4-7]
MLVEDLPLFFGQEWRYSWILRNFMMISRNLSLLLILYLLFQVIVCWLGLRFLRRIKMKNLIILLMVVLSSLAGWVMGWLLSWDILLLGLVFFIYSAFKEEDNMRDALLKHGALPLAIVAVISVFTNGNPTLGGSEILNFITMWKGANL